MAPSASPRLRVLSVGGNAVSAFLSWRLQATNACDVTLVWKSGFDSVSQYGISFKSKQLGNERFKPRSVVRTPEDAASAGGYDYVLLCVKALPDVYDLAAVIESVVTPQHTCIIVNTTNSLGVEPYLQTRYPSNVILSLVSGANINQLGPSEFEHMGDSDVWVGATVKNSEIARTVQMDMAEALALTLVSGNVNCHVSPNIRQQQWERMIGPIAFYPLSVLLDTPNHAVMLEKPGIRKLVNDVIDELILIASGDGCKFPNEFRGRVIEVMSQPSSHNSTMYQDFIARRPIEIEIYLGSPIKVAQMVGKKAPHCETLYCVLNHMNQANQTKTPGSSPPPTATPPQQRQAPRPQLATRNRPQPNGSGPNGVPPGRRARPPMNGATQSPNGDEFLGRNGGYSPKPPPNGVSRRNSFENDLEEFGHIALYPEMLEAEDGAYLADSAGPGMDGNGGSRGNGGEFNRQRGPPPGELAFRERELALRQRDLELREEEMMRRSAPGSRNGPSATPGGRGHSRIYEDDDDDEVYYESTSVVPPVDPDSIDMMSVTSRRTRRVPSAGNLRNMDPGLVPPNARAPRHSMGPPRPAGARNRTSARLVSEIPGLHDNIIENPLMGYSSNRYGAVDRKMLSDTSRNNSLSTARLGDMRDDMAFSGLAQRGGPYSSHPGTPPLPRPGSRPNGHPGPGNGYPPDFRGRGAPGYPPMRPPMGRFPSGPREHPVPAQGNHHNYDPVSQSHPTKGPLSNKNRSTTGSTSASATSGDSGSRGSGRLGSEYSAFSSSSSIEKKSEVHR